MQGQCQLSFSIAGQRYRQRVLVGNITCEGVMGMDFLSKHKAVLDLSNGVLGLTGKLIPTNRGVNSLCARIAIKENVADPP